MPAWPGPARAAWRAREGSALALCRWPSGAGHAGLVPVAAAALGAGEPGEGVDGGAGVGVRIEADAALGADAAPLAGQQRAAEQVGPDRHAVEAPLVPLRPDAGQRGLVGEQRELERLGHRCGFRPGGHDSPTNVSKAAYGHTAKTARRRRRFES